MGRRFIALLVGGVVVAASLGASIAIAGSQVPVSQDSAPLWVLHARSFSGGLSGGARSLLSSVGRATTSDTARSSAPAVSARRNVQMNDDSYPPVPQNETSVAYDITNPRVAIAAANDYVSAVDVAVMRTADGGRHWATTRVVPSFVPTRDNCNGGDPSVAYSLRDHAFYLSSLCFFGDNAVSELHVFKSLDGGKTWNPGRQSAVVATNANAHGVPNPAFFNDKPWLTIDNYPSSPHFGRVYVTWTQYHMLPDGSSDHCPARIAYTDAIPSTDPSQAVFVQQRVPSDHHVGVGQQYTQATIEGDGSVDVSSVVEGCDSGLETSLSLTRSTNGGETFGPVRRIDPPGTFIYPSARLLPNKTFRQAAAPSMTYSAPRHELTIVYGNLIHRKASGVDIDEQHSSNGGASWSPPQILGLPRGAPVPNDQFFPWVSASPTGALVAIWLDNRNDPNDRLIETWQATSSNGGVTWNSAPISNTAWDPDRGFYTDGHFIGDYIGVVYSPIGIYATWPDARDSDIDATGIGETDIWTAVQTSQ